MADTAAGRGWGEFHKRYDLQGLPQVPDDGVVRRYRELIGARDRRILLLGITRALAGLGRDLTALDFNPTQIVRMWPGDAPDRRAQLGDWRDLEPPQDRFSAAVGDGSLSTLAWPGEYRSVLGRVAAALAPRGLVVLRCFLAPDEPETLEQVVEDVLAGRERDCNAARWRVAMALVDANGCVPARAFASAWRRQFPDFAALAERTGWSLEAMNVIFDGFGRSDQQFSFVTRAALLGTLPPTLGEARFEPSGTYPLAERCPFLVVERVG